MTAKLALEEVAAQLSRLVRGEITWQILGDPWARYSGDREFITSDGWRFVVFNDCDEFDYVESAFSPDGRRHDFNDAPHDEWMLAMVDAPAGWKGPFGGARALQKLAEDAPVIARP